MNKGGCIMAITPKGQEPAYLKNRMDMLFAKLDEAYPDKVMLYKRGEIKGRILHPI